MAIVKKVLDYIEKIVIIGSIITFSIMIIMGILQVISRHIPGSNLYFTEELARFMFIWAVFLASAICTRKQSHAAIELFVSWMPKGLKKISLFIASVCSLFFFALIFIKGIQLTMVTWSQASPAMEIPMGIIYLAIPVGGFLMLIFTIENIYKEIINSSETAA
ncbi:MAG: TRAP transporter small permease [Peptococcales bacterium]